MQHNIFNGKLYRTQEIFVPLPTKIVH